MSSEPLFYTHEALDRAHLLRQDQAQIESYFQSKQTKFIVHWRNHHLFQSKNGEIRALTLDYQSVQQLDFDHSFFLGLYQDEPIFGIDLSHLEEEVVLTAYSEAEIGDLRSHAPLMDQGEASLLAYVRGMFTWHKTHLYCGKCGYETVSVNSGHERRCTNHHCQNTLFPRIDPAVIVLVEHQFEDGIKRCLLGRHKRSKAGMYSTLAGFVEPGESLEMTVKREMFEEAGIDVEDIQYVASQPWPFPSSIMLGFYAKAKTHELVLDADELAEAGWFSASELKEKSESGEITLSGSDSIARYLITNWMAEQL